MTGNYCEGVSRTMQEALGPFLSCEAPLMAFRDSASYWYSYVCRVLYLLATREANQQLQWRRGFECKNNLFTPIKLLYM